MLDYNMALMSASSISPILSLCIALMLQTDIVVIFQPDIVVML